MGSCRSWDISRFLGWREKAPLSAGPWGVDKQGSPGCPCPCGVRCELTSWPLNTETFEKNPKTRDEGMPKEKSLTVATDSYKMTQLPDFTGSRDSVLMDHITEHWSPQCPHSDTMNTDPKSSPRFNTMTVWRPHLKDFSYCSTSGQSICANLTAWSFCFVNCQPKGWLGHIPLPGIFIHKDSSW